MQENVILKLNSLFDLIKLSEKSKLTISKVLVGVDNNILEDWFDKIQIKNGIIAGTFYQEIVKKLSSSDFVSLYEALGYDFELQGHWMDYWCYGSQGCMSKKGYTCSSQTCIQT